MLRLGVIPDFCEERWFSMDLVADMLLREIREGRAGEATGESLVPTFAKRFTRLPIIGARGMAFNADRMLNRMRDYPKHLKKMAHDFDGYHVCDHAYANVVHALPSARTGVFCHDLDTFRCLFEPQKDPRPQWFKAMMRRILSGMQKAAIVFYTTSEIRRQIVERGLVEESRLVQATLGVSDVYSPNMNSTDTENSVLKKINGRRFLLHVGSCIPRKRIDVLLNVFAGVRAKHPEMVFVKVGGPLTAEQRELSERLKLGASLILADRLNSSELPALYRSATVTLQPSDAEGFGLPVAEALACGSIVVASAIPALVEVGGDAVVFCPVGDVDAWVSCVCRIVDHPDLAPNTATRLNRAAQFSWATHARTICDAYRRLNRVD